MLVVLASMTVFASPSSVPSVADLSKLYNTTNNIVLACYFDEAVCNDIIFVGTYNNWSATPSQCSKMTALQGYKGWYAVAVPWSWYYNNGTSDYPSGKPIQLMSDGSLDWTYQTGDVGAWINMGVSGTKTAWVNSGYDNEADIYYPEAGVYIYEIAYWKKHKSPCAPTVKHDYKITLYAPDACPDMKPAIIGDFNNWEAGIPMTEGKDANSKTVYTYTLKDEAEGHAFKIREVKDVDWTNELQYFDSYYYEWRKFDDYELGQETNIVLDHSDNSRYRFAKCEPDYRPTYQIVVMPPKCDANPEFKPIIVTFGDNIIYNDMTRGTYNGSDAWLLTIHEEPGRFFQIAESEYGLGNQIQWYDTNRKLWWGFPLREFPWNSETMTTLVYDYSDANRYRYPLCGKLNYDDKTMLNLKVRFKAPAGAPTSVEIVGDFGGLDTWGNGVRMTFENGYYTATVKTTANNQFKIREAGNSNNYLIYADGNDTENFVFGDFIDASGQTALIDFSDYTRYDWSGKGDSPFINVRTYYYVGGLNGWSSTDKSYPFKVLNDGRTWEATITAFENDGWFKIAPDYAYDYPSSFWDNLMCAPYEGCEDLKGDMIFGNAGAWHMPKSDSIYSYRIRIVPAEMTFEILPQTILLESDVLNVYDANGNDVTKKVSIVWYDAQKKVIGNGSIIGGLEEGTQVYYSVMLDKTLGTQYQEILYKKAVIDRTVKRDTLSLIKKVKVHGKVSAYGDPIQRAKADIRQWLNGKYVYETYTLTDTKGEFAIELYNDSTEIVLSAEGYMDRKIAVAHLNKDGELGELEMEKVRGKVLALNITYQEATQTGTEPLVQAWYPDTRNLDYTVRNLTTGKNLDNYGVQQGNIILPDGTNQGDKMQVAIRSLNNKFAETTGTGTIGTNDTAVITLNLLAFGALEVNYDQKADASLLAMLYDNTGKLQMRTVCTTSKLTFSNLAAGDYTLVTMGYNGAVGSLSELSELTEMDMRDGRDYVSKKVKIRDGYITSVNVLSVPELDASKFEYTGSNTSFLPNKMQLVVGNFITLSARVDFKAQYAGKVDNIKIIVDIPDGCEFVPNSVVIGTKALPHSLDGSKLTITLSKEDIDARIRFCVIPVETGSFMTAAYVEFNSNGIKTQPIGQIKFEATAGELFVPSTTNKATISVGGIGVPKAEVEVYDNENLIGTTKSLGNGKWQMNCELSNAYNLSMHEIYVKYRGEGNIVGKTETKICYYDINSIVPKTVTMINTAHPAGNLTPTVYESVFDYEAILSVQNYYLYWPDYPDFTFIIDLSDNDTAKVSDVELYVYTTDGGKRRLPATYDGNMGKFVASGSFDMYSLPTNVSVEFQVSTPALVDDQKFVEAINSINNLQETIKKDEHEIDALINDWWQAMETGAASDEYLNEISARLGINIDNVDVSTLTLTNEAFQAMLDSTNNTYQAYSSVLSDFDGLDILNLEEGLLEGITIKSASSLNVKDLESNGFDKIQKTDSDWLYVKFGDDKYILVDFEQDIYIEFANQDSSIVVVNRQLMKRNSAEILYEKSDQLLDGINKIATLADHARPLIISWITKNSKEIETYAAIGKDAYKGNGVVDAVLSKRCLEEVRRLSAAQTRLRTVLKWLDNLKVGKVLGVAGNLYSLVKDINEGAKKVAKFDALFDAVPNCERVAIDAVVLKEDILKKQKGCLSYYILAADANIAMLVATIGGLTLLPETGGASLSAVAVSLGVSFAKDGIDWAYNKWFDHDVKMIEKRINELKKECKADNDNGGGDPCTEHKTPENDPSGYVYEAVPTNRLEDVTATIYYRDEETPVPWVAEEFGQINPQITDASGLYAWDVPQGFWKVTFTKPGYETTETDWLPVPPPQLEINIPMSQAVAPYVVSATGSSSGILLEFSKYMKPATLTADSRIFVTCNGTKIGGSVEMLNLEEDPYVQQKYASKIKFVPNRHFQPSDNVTITVKKEVESYAGMQMTEDFVQQIAIASEVNEMVCDSVIMVDYTDSTVLNIAVLPAEAAKDIVVYVESTSSMITATNQTSVTLDNAGKARLTVYGKLPGNASLHLYIPKADVDKYVKVNVLKKESGIVIKPKASKLTGSTFDNDYLLTLSCATPGADIYYTLDGTCPCNEQTRIKYTRPIQLPEGEVTLQAVAVREGMTDSEIATYAYVVSKNSPEGIEAVPSGNYEISYQAGDVSISGAQGATCHIYDLLGRELVNQYVPTNNATIRVPKNDLYIVSLVFANKQTYVCRVLAE